MATSGRAGLAAAFTVVLLAGCFQVYDPELASTPQLEPSENDVGVDAGVDAGPVCGRAVPAYPGGDDSGTLTLTFAFVDSTLDPTYLETHWHEVAYDLDGICTDSTLTSSCVGETIVGDGPDGEDNVFGQFLVSVLSAVRPEQDLGSYANMRLEQGGSNPLLHVEGWNGEATDPRVRVWFSVAAEFEASDGGETPVWDGNDVFYPRDDDFVEGDLDVALAEDDSAYVVDGVLVARISQTSLLIPQGMGAPAIVINARDMTITAEITTEGLSEVSLTGRWRVLDLLQAFVDAGYCQGTPEYLGITSVVDSYSDIRSDPRSDNMGADCDALSIGVGFAGRVVELGSETREANYATGSCE